MKTILEYIQSYWHSYLSIPLLTGLCLVLGLFLSLRYGLHFNPWLESYPFIYRWIIATCFYSLPFFLLLVLYSLVQNDFIFWNQKSFWVLTGLILLPLILIQFSNVFSFLLTIFPSTDHPYLSGILYNFKSIIGYLIPAIIYYLIQPSIQGSHFYGAAKMDGSKIGLYFGLIFCMIPLLVWASFSKDFLQAYPRSGIKMVADGRWEYLVLFEVSYILQFIALEIFFRGFIVLSLGTFIQGYSIYIMVAMYAFLHCYKPLPETIGSIFGGFLLGILSYYSRSLWGGMIAHVGIAVIMELLAFGQYTWRGGR